MVISKKIKSLDRFFSYNRNFFIFTIVALVGISIALVVIAFLKENVKIRKHMLTVAFKEQKLTSVARNVKITYFIDTENEKVIIEGAHGTSGDENDNVMKNCIIKTPHLRDKIYSGPTEIIEFNGSNGNFNVPKQMSLYNNDFGQKNYIKTTSLDGNYNDVITSDRPFSIQDEDLFLSGDNLYLVATEKYLRITKNAHVQQNTALKRKVDKSKKQNIYDIKSQKMEVLGKDSTVIFEKNVVFNNGNLTVKSEYGRLLFDDEYKIRNIFLSKSVHIQQKDSNITSDFGFYNKEKESMVFYKNVELKNKNGYSKNDFYFYDTKREEGMTFGERTPLDGAEQRKIYDLLDDFVNALNDDKNKNYIKKIINENERFNKERRRKKDTKTDKDVVIDRTKRVRVNINEF